MRALLPLIVCALLLCACGYRGALYLPKPDAEKPVTPPAQQKEEKKPGM